MSSSRQQRGPGSRPDTRRHASAVATRYFSLVDGLGTVAGTMVTANLGEGRITRERYWQLVADGTIGPDDRVELLEGVIVAMSPQNPPHAFVMTRLPRLLGAALGSEVTMRTQLPLEVGACSTPEPDVAIVPGRDADYVAGHPTTAVLVIEVADSTLSQDRLTKGPLYAAGGIPEYWIVNLRDACVEVYRDPVSAERRYAERVIARAGDRLEPLGLPGLVLAVSDILPPHPSS